MIVVVGRPELLRGQIPRDALKGMAASICLAVAAGGARPELVGSVGDDAEGDRVAVLLGQAGIGHAALLRDPAGRTPVLGEDRTPPPRLDVGDVELGLRYLADVRVLVLAEALSPDSEAAALEAASYHGAALIAILPAGAEPGPRFPLGTTVLEAPSDAGSAFHILVARYAIALAGGTDPEAAFRAASTATRWQPAAR